MSGELINKFENLPWNDQTVDNFEKLFNVNLPFEKTELVDVGSLVKAYTREIKVDGYRFMVDLQPQYGHKFYKSLHKLLPKNIRKKGIYQGMPKAVSLYVNGELEQNFNSISEASRVMGMTVKRIKRAIVKGRILNNKYKFVLKGVNNGENNTIQESKNVLTGNIEIHNITSNTSENTKL